MTQRRRNHYAWVVSVRVPSEWSSLEARAIAAAERQMSFGWSGGDAAAAPEAAGVAPQSWPWATKITAVASASIVKFAVSAPVPALTIAVAIAETYAAESTMLVNATKAVAIAAAATATGIAGFESVAERRPASMRCGLAGRLRARRCSEARLDCRDCVAAITTMAGNATASATKLQRFDAINLHSVSGNNSLHLQDPGAKMLC